MDFIIKLANEIEKSIKEKVKDKKIGIAFSGGVDSTTLAYISKKYAKKVVLYTVGFRESKDVLYSLKLSKKLDLEFNLYLFEEDDIKELYKRVEGRFNLGFLKSEILAPLEKIFEMSNEDFLLFGSGTEELFVGYDRYYSWKKEGMKEEEINRRLREEYKNLFDKGDIYYIKEIAKIYNKEAVFPYCSKEIEQIVFSIPLELRMKDKEKKKHVLREAAKILGVPQEAIERPKKALQYGTEVHKNLLKIKKKGKL